MLSGMEIGVLGATGPAGRGLAARFADAGFDVIIGSRDPSRAKTVADELSEQWGSRVATLRPGTNDDAAAAEDVVVIATTWEAAMDTTAAHAGQLGGKVVIAMANGLQRVGREFADGSFLWPGYGDNSRVLDWICRRLEGDADALDTPIESDVVACGDDADARRVVRDLATTIPNLRAFDGGSLANAVGIEAFAAVLLTVNIRHHGRGTLRLLGLEEGER